MGEGVDYSFSRPDIPTLRQWGKEFVMRYVGLGTTDKLLNRWEAGVIHANGMDVVCLAEQWEDSALQGYGLGYSHGVVAFTSARLAGMPADRPIYFAVDFDAQPWQYPQIFSYFDGVAAAIGRENTGVYAGIRVIDAMAAAGKAFWFYQTYAWSYGQVSKWTNVYQYLNRQQLGGGEVDLDRSLTYDFGQWGRPLPPPGQGDEPLPPDTSGLPDVKEDGPWDYSGHIRALADTFDGVAADLDGHASGMGSLMS